MKIAILLPMFVCATTSTLIAQQPSFSLPRSSPEEQGLSSTALLRFVQALDQQVDTMNSLMLVRHGQVVAEGWWAPYDAQTRHELYSLSKSFCSTAVGLAIAEGKLTLDDTVLSSLPEDAPLEPSSNLKGMRVRDLLCMSTGHHEEEVRKFSFSSSQRLTKQFLDMPVAHKPGTHFVYNTPATYMLSAMVQKATGTTVLEYLRPRLFEPLGIENPTWEASAQGITIGGYGLSVRTEDIARFGQLYLQQGKWRGKQLLPASWVEAATARQTSNGSSPDSDWDQGYGYQFWRCRHNLYRGDGAFGQFCIIMPKQDAVVALTSGTRDMQAVMKLVWEHLLPAMQQMPSRANPDTHKNLARALASLRVKSEAGRTNSPLSPQVAGKKFAFPANEQKVEAISLEGGPAEMDTLVARINGTEYRLACGHGEWRKGRFAYGERPEQPVAATGAWRTDDTYAAKVCFYETPYYLTFLLKFSEGKLFLDAEYNVSFGPTKQPQLIGQLE